MAEPTAPCRSRWAPEFAQVMGVAEGVIDVGKGGVGAKMVMHDNAALQPRGNVAARLSDPVEGVALARGRMQPLQRARDAKTGFVEMPDPRLTHARPDRVIDALEILRLPARPRRQARRADERRAEEVLKRLRRPVLGVELYVE